MIKRPMLACKESPSTYKEFFKELRFPLMLSPKLDGIRAVVQKGIVNSKTMKPIRSYQVQDTLSFAEHCDGELTIGEPTNPRCINLCQSHIMSFDKPHEDLRFYIFDWIEKTDLPFYQRLERAEKFARCAPEMSNIISVPHITVEHCDDLLAFEDSCLRANYEGIMMRDPLAHYKEGRSTWREGFLYKLKRFSDAEGRVVGFEERMINTNTQERNELGYAKRSKASEGLMPSGLLGKFIVEYEESTITVATGKFTADDLKYIWENREVFLGKFLKFRHFQYGAKDAPRFASAITFRSEEDM